MQFEAMSCRKRKQADEVLSAKVPRVEGGEPLSASCMVPDRVSEVDPAVVTHLRDNTGETKRTYFANRADDLFLGPPLVFNQIPGGSRRRSTFLF